MLWFRRHGRHAKGFWRDNTLCVRHAGILKCNTLRTLVPFCSESILRLVFLDFISRQNSSNLRENVRNISVLNNVSPLPFPVMERWVLAVESGWIRRGGSGHANQWRYLGTGHQDELQVRGLSYSSEYWCGSCCVNSAWNSTKLSENVCL